MDWGSCQIEPAGQRIGQPYRHPLALRGGASRRGQAAHRLGATAPVSSAKGAEQRDVRLGRLEAVLFLAREPLAARKLSQLASLADGTEARTLVRRLNERYDSEGTAFRVEQIAGGYQLLTRPAFAPWLRRLQATPAETRLSGPALETLAVVAYRQPVLRADIESIRGVQSAEMLRQLMERDLVRIAGRSDELGRPFLYGTTKRFLQVFGLRSLDELPRSKAWDSASCDESNPLDETFQPSDPEEESEVRFHAAAELELEEQLESHRRSSVALAPHDLRAADDEDDDFDDEDEDEEDDDFEDEEEEDDDEGFEDEEWEEVDDEDEEDEEGDDDEEWDDEEEDEDWDDDEDEDEEWEDDDEEDEDDDMDDD